MNVCGKEHPVLRRRFHGAPLGIAVELYFPLRHDSQLHHPFTHSKRKVYRGGGKEARRLKPAL